MMAEVQFNGLGAAPAPPSGYKKQALSRVWQLLDPGLLVNMRASAGENRGESAGVRAADSTNENAAESQCVCCKACQCVL